mgnify:CR=1 FL=1
MKNNLLNSYASTFASFLIREVREEFSDRIILYGSVAKGEATAKSDVDIFIDTKSKKIEKEIKEIIDRFYKSRESALFKVQGVDNELSIKVGELERWESLHHSIMSDGIILWGKYEGKEVLSGSIHSLIFSWDKIEKNRGAFLNKLYGFSVKGKKYPGLLEKFEGEKVGKSSIIVPMKFREEFIVVFKKYKVKVRQKEVFVSS